MKIYGNNNAVVCEAEDGMMFVLEPEEYANIKFAIEAADDMAHCTVYTPTDCANALDTVISELYPDGFGEEYGEIVGVMASMLAWACCNREHELAMEIVLELGRYA